MIRAKEDAPISTLYLLAILNHPLCEAMIRTNTSVFRGGYYSHGKQFIKELPIPVPEDEAAKAAIVQQAENVVSALKALNAARTPHERTRRERVSKDARAQLEREVSALFGLSAEDAEIIESVPVPS
jgi:hypothetical protein